MITSTRRQRGITMTIEQAIELIRTTDVAKIALPGGIQVYRCGKVIRIDVPLDK